MVDEYIVTTGLLEIVLAIVVFKLLREFRRIGAPSWWSYRVLLLSLPFLITNIPVGVFASLTSRNPQGVLQFLRAVLPAWANVIYVVAIMAVVNLLLFSLCCRGILRGYAMLRATHETLGTDT